MNGMTMLYNKVGEYLMDAASQTELACGYAKETDSDARIAIRDRLMLANVRLVIKLAHEMSGRGASIEDLVGAGMEGLLVAVEKYDCERGASFPTYATYWVRDRMRSQISRYRTAVTIDKSTYGRMLAVRRMDGDEDEMMERLGVGERAIRSYADGLSVTSLSDMGNDGKDFDVIDDLSETVDERIERHERMEHLAKAMAYALTEREREVISKRFGLDRDRVRIDDIAAQMHVTRQRVQQIEETARLKLRQYVMENGYARD